MMGNGTKLAKSSVLTPLPEKQGLKHCEKSKRRFFEAVLTPLPEKQGLKHVINIKFPAVCISINATSRKTRIETK